MSNLIFPSQIKGLRMASLKTSEYRSLSQNSPNAYTLRIAQTINPIWHFQLLYDYLYDVHLSPNNTQFYSPYTDFQTLMGFIQARKGKWDDFLFFDPVDNSAAGNRG